jgi:BMFP domain-containing protein YqiC
MDALLKKHRGGSEADVGAPSGHAATPAPSPEPTPPPGAWLPVLTDVIERGTPPIVAVAAAPPAVASPLSSAPSPVPAAVVMPTADVNDTLAEQLMSELAPRLSEAMEKQVAAELRKNLDQTVAGLLSQLDVNVREIVRDAVAEKLRQPRDPST